LAALVQIGRLLNRSATLCETLSTIWKIKRVLYVNDEREIRDYVNQSLLDIRKVLTDAISKVNDSSPAAKAFRIMRAACREFLTQPHSDPLIGKTVRRYYVPPPPGVRGSATDASALPKQEEPKLPARDMSSKVTEDNFFVSLGKLRGVFGQQLAELAYLYSIDFEQDLATILPPEPQSDD
jgi:hypothetical protein